MHTKETDRQKKEVNKLKKQVVLEKKEIKKIKKVVCREDAQRCKEVVDKAQEEIDRRYKELERNKQELEEEKAKLMYQKNNYQAESKLKFEELKSTLLMKLDREKTNQRLCAQKERNLLRRECQTKINDADKELYEKYSKECKDEINKINFGSEEFKEKLRLERLKENQEYKELKMNLTKELGAFEAKNLQLNGILKTISQGSKQLISRILEDLEELITCPISLEIYKNPVIYSSGNTIDLDSFSKIVEKQGFICPFTRKIMEKNLNFQNKIAVDLKELYYKYKDQKDILNIV
mmetsp:Transcript_10649/g.9374  ORF Transcript_10649/g.9374 Transcript_10649/m.9374 type:complete len:293 (+) Transcript_10649:708-1586(+)